MKEKLKAICTWLAISAVIFVILLATRFGVMGFLDKLNPTDQGPPAERAEERFITLSNMVMQLNRNQFTLAQIVSNRTTMQTQTVVVTNWFPLPGMGEDYGYTPEQSQKAETLLILPDTNGIKHAVPVLPVEPSEVQE